MRKKRRRKVTGLGCRAHVEKKFKKKKGKWQRNIVVRLMGTWRWTGQITPSLFSSPSYTPHHVLLGSYVQENQRKKVYTHTLARPAGHPLSWHTHMIIACVQIGTYRPSTLFVSPVSCWPIFVPSFFVCLLLLLLVWAVWRNLLWE
jgi:hypothetical protein